MGTKISNLSEISSLLTTKEKMEDGVLGFSKQFKLGHLLRPFAQLKKQGYCLLSILTAMILSRFGGLSIYAMQKTGQTDMDDNTIYRLMDNPQINWRSMLLSFAGQFLRCVQSKGETNEKEKCFVPDDTDIIKTGKTVEGISRIYNHVKHTYIFGFKLLAVCYWDGKSLIPCDFSLHRESREKNYGLTAKERKKQYHQEYPSDCACSERFKELDSEKTVTGLSMIKRAVRRGFLASYVLMDSWFVSENMLKNIRKIKKGMLHVTGMCKMDKRKFTVNDRDYNSDSLIKLNERRNAHKSKKYRSTYITVTGKYKGLPVKLFYIKYKNAQTWSLLLTTDLSLTFTKAMELYQIRWSIEVLFKETKQYLRLGKAQNTCFCGQVADITLTFITYIILALQKRFQSYETMGDLFRETQSRLVEATVYERILLIFVKIVGQLLEIFSIDVTEFMEKIIANDENSEKILNILSAINQANTDMCENKNAS
jgi:hypothetical protein